MGAAATLLLSAAPWGSCSGSNAWDARQYCGCSMSPWHHHVNHLSTRGCVSKRALSAQSAAITDEVDASINISESHLLKQRRRKSRPSLDRRCGIAGGSLVEAMWNSADTCAVTFSP